MHSLADLVVRQTAENQTTERRKSIFAESFVTFDDQKLSPGDLIPIPKPNNNTNNPFSSSTRRSSRAANSRRQSFVISDEENKDISHFLEHGNANNRRNSDSLSGDHNKPVMRSALLFVPKNNKNKHEEEKQQQEDLLMASDVNHLTDTKTYANLLSNEIESIRDTSDLVFTKRKEQEEAMAEKRRRNGLVLKSSNKKTRTNNKDNNSQNNTTTPSLGLFAGARNNASMKNLMSFRKQKQDDDDYHSRHGSSSTNNLKNLNSMVRRQSTFRKKSFLQTDKKSNNNNNNNNNNNATVQFGDDLENLGDTFASGAFEFLKSEDGTNMLLSSEDGGSRNSDDSSDDHHDKEEEEDEDFEKQMMNQATKCEDFFWKHTLTERITHNNLLKVLLKHAGVTLKPTAVRIIEQILFSGNSTDYSISAKCTAANSVSDPDFEAAFSSSKKRRSTTRYPTNNDNDDSTTNNNIPSSSSSCFKQETPSSSLNAAVDSSLRLLDTVIYKLDKPWLDLPSIQDDIILPLNKFWRDLQRFSSDLMTSLPHHPSSSSPTDTLMIMSEQDKHKMATHRESVRTAREIAAVLFCLGTVLQHRRRYVARECEKCKKKQDYRNEKSTRRQSMWNKSTTSHHPADNVDDDEKNKKEQEKEEEIRIPKYKHDMWLGLRFLLSTSAGFLQSEGAVKVQIDDLFKGISLEGLSVEEIDVDEEQRLKVKQLQEQREAEKEREYMMMIEAQAKNENSNVIQIRKSRRTRGQPDEPDDLFVSDDDSDADQDELAGDQQEHDGKDSNKLVIDDASRNVIPRPNSELAQQQRNNMSSIIISRPSEMVVARVGIGSHMKKTLIPLAHQKKTRQQVEAETAKFLIERKTQEDHFRVVERAFDKYLILSRQVELKRKNQDDENRIAYQQKQKQKPQHLSPLRQIKSSPASSSSALLSCPSPSALVTTTSHPKSIFNMAAYTTDFPREPRRNFALTLKKMIENDGEDNNVEEIEKNYNSHHRHHRLLLDGPSTPLFLLKDNSERRRRERSQNNNNNNGNNAVFASGDPDVEQQQQQQQNDDSSSPFFLTDTNTTFTYVRNFSRAQHAQTPSLKKESSDRSKRRRSTWTPSPDSKMTNKNENRIYGNRKSRAMFGMSPSFEVAASSVSRSLQLKPML